MVEEEKKGDENPIAQIRFQDIWDDYKGWKIDRQHHVMEASISGKKYRSLVVVGLIDPSSFMLISSFPFHIF